MNAVGTAPPSLRQTADGDWGSGEERAGPPGTPLPGPFDRLPSHNWQWFALRGAVAILLGIGALFMPGAALFAFATVLAAFSFADGVLALVSGISGAQRKEERWWPLILSGLLGIAVGAAFVIFPWLGTLVYAIAAIVLIAAWAIATGVLEILAARRLRRAIEGEWLLMLLGAMSVMIGTLLLALLSWTPGATILSFAWLIGSYALAAGVLLLVLAFRLKRHGGGSPGSTA